MMVVFYGLEIFTSLKTDQENECRGFIQILLVSCTKADGRGNIFPAEMMKLTPLQFSCGRIIVYVAKFKVICEKLFHFLEM